MNKNKAKMPTTWNLTPLFRDDNDPELKKEEARSVGISNRFVKKWEPRTDWLQNPAVLKEALDEYNEWLTISGANAKVGYYWGLRSALEQDNTKIKARAQLASNVAKKLANDAQFFEHRLAKVAPETQAKFLSAKELGVYRHFLQNLFADAKYLLSEPEEKILTLTGQSAHGDWIDMTSELLSKKELLVVDEKERLVKKPLATVMSLLSDRNKKIRDEAAKALHGHLTDYADIAEHEMNAILGYKKIRDELRGLKRPDEARHVSDDIETKTVDALISAVAEKFPIAQKYYRLKAKLLNQKKLAYHERNVPVGSFDKKFDYETSTNLISSVFHNLDSQFGKIFDSFVDRGQIDAFPRRGKNDGAFCIHQLITLPTYILLNHNNELRDVLTIAHEAGHGINNELMKKQPAIYFGTTLATAEVASTFMEDFVLEKIREEAGEKEKLTLIVQKLNEDISTIFRQVALYRFEQELHKTYREVGYLSKEIIGGIFKKHMAAYMGRAVSQDPGAENWWVYWSHIRNFFYVYSYASGLLISKALQRLVRADKNKIKLVKEFLSAGTSNSPRNIFLNLGIDIADPKFWSTGLAEIEADLREAERLTRSLDKNKKQR